MPGSQSAIKLAESICNPILAFTSLYSVLVRAQDKVKEKHIQNHIHIHIYIYIYNYFYIYTVHTYFVIFLSFLTPLFAQVLRDGKEVQVPVPTVVAGDIAACLESVILLVCWFFWGLEIMASIYGRHGRATRGWMQVHRNGVIPPSFHIGYFPAARTMKRHSDELIALHPRPRWFWAPETWCLLTCGCLRPRISRSVRWPLQAQSWAARLWRW